MRSVVFALAVLAAGTAAARSPVPPPGAVPPPPPPPRVESQLPSASGLLSYNFGQRQPVPVGDGPLRVSVDNNTVSPRGGYALLRVSLENRADREDRVHLRYQWRGDGSAEITRMVEVPAQARRVTWLLIPQNAAYGTFSANARGITEPGQVGIHFTEPQQRAVLSLGSDPDFQILVGAAPDTTVYTVMVRSVAPEEAPHELAAYVGFHTVVVPGAFETLDEPVRRALEAYAATGGHLVLANPPRTPKTYLPLLPRAHSPAEDAYAYGFGRVRLCPTEAEAPGVCATGVVSDLRRPVVPVVPRGPNSQVSYAHNPYETGAEDNDPPMTESERFLLPQATAPVGRFLLIILVFTLAMGPGSVWVARKKGPPMLLLSIPLTAFVTCALIVLWSVLVDGFRIHSAVRGVTLLDQANNRAITLGVQGWYANLAPGDVHYDTATALLPPRWQYDKPQVPSIDWTRGPLVSDGFVPSRTYREWGLVSVAPTRARLSARLSENPRVLTVENALGADIQELHVLLGGQLWKVGAVRDGGSVQVPVTRAAETFEVDLKPFASRFRPEALSQVDAPLHEGAFLAFLGGDGPAFVPTGGMKPSWFESGHVVRGEVTP